MKPVSVDPPRPVEGQHVVYAADQPEYQPLPAWKHSDGRLVTRWRLTWRERLAALLGRDLFLEVIQPDGMSPSGARSPLSRPADLPSADWLYVNLRWNEPRTIGDLAESLSLPRRTVEQAVETLRRSGAPICTGSRGVWLSQSSEELMAQYRALRRRAVHQMSNIRQLRKTAEAMRGIHQETLWAQT